jgi:dCTP deaminase
LREAIEGGPDRRRSVRLRHVQPSSIDVRVDRLFRVFRNHTAGIIDVKLDLADLTELVEIAPRACSCCTRASSCSARRSSASPSRRPGRPHRGQVEPRSPRPAHPLDAGFIDAGFDGHVTLELANVASLPITIYPGMKIGQISFMQMTTPADQPYGKGAAGSKYQGQRGPTPSRYFENFR